MKKYAWILLTFLIACRSTSNLHSTPSLSFISNPSSSDPSHSRFQALANKVMISSQGTRTTEAGLEILEKGGNLFDAFTALSFAISVERPHSTGLGGGGFVLFYQAKDKKVSSLDFRETAPRKAHAKMFLNDQGEPVADKSLTGGLAVATPGMVAGVLEIHKKYGKLPLKTVLEPAIRLAESGFPVYPALSKAMQVSTERLARFPDSKKIFLSPDGGPWPIGHILIQKDLGRTLRKIAQSGTRGFYQGSVARGISSSVRKAQGFLDEQDLRGYRTKWRAPLKGTYDGYEIYSQPPPSSGGMHVLEILNIVEKSDLSQWGPQDPRSIHLTASAMQQSFADRARYAGDPDFSPIPVENLISKTYADQIRAQIHPDKARKMSEVPTKEESPDTTHFTLMDAEGNTISSTQTINGFFGSALVAEGTGIVLNNEMDDFAAKVGASNLFGAIGGEKNLVAPGKRPVSSMSPTLVLENGKPILAMGTPSGTRIITCVALTLLNVLEYRLPLWDAVSLVRYHQQWSPDELQIEAPLFPEGTMDALKQKGWNLKEKDGGCRVQVIQNEKGVLHGVSDMREEGLSLGL